MPKKQVIDIKILRSIAASRSLAVFPALQAAIDRLGFIQADPIRAPARAQDLILRHRVPKYRAGDLERKYPELEAEEDYFYAYGFMSRKLWRLMHPRCAGKVTDFEKQVLDAVSELGEAHPTELDKHLGNRRVRNAWGGTSKATTQALDWLHYRGLLRVARRDKGIRVFSTARQMPEADVTGNKMKGRVLALVNLLAPIPLRSLRTMTARQMNRYMPGLGTAPKFLSKMILDGELRAIQTDGETYLIPPDCDMAAQAPRGIKFLAPFDPLVWDRSRFETFWGWKYRFEAYTPPKKRERGYYAMPLLWNDDIIGWANASVSDGALKVETGFIHSRPKSREFLRELEAETARLALFLDIHNKHTK